MDVLSRGAMVDRPGTERIHTRSLSKSDPRGLARVGRGSTDRISRERRTSSLLRSETPVSRVAVRQEHEGSRYSSRLTSRSVYHYHRAHYPSHRIFYWITWPNCCRPICYASGPDYTFGFFWPYYHRKFIFISIGGYWPCYTYRRYYWYGCHPYRWYGDCPPNYYYYNDEPLQPDAVGRARQKLEEAPPAEPAEETVADRYFDQAVKAFEAGEYATAAAKFHNAQALARDDIVVPFARVQALFAKGDYGQAAEVLRRALVISSPEKEGVFYPRGLYSDQALLEQQVQRLAEQVESNPLDADLRLLLGYQLLGMGKLDESASHLQNARLNGRNSQATTIL
ncbi:MAG: tetratricopeptide repeat protein, partial [Planctomycetota bacterium]